MPVAVEIPKDKWAGKVREVTIGATAAEGGTRTSTVTLGGDTSLPFLTVEGAPYDMGLQHGRLMKERIRTVYKKYLKECAF